MRRHPALVQLSSDHHHALVLARRAYRAAIGESEEAPGDVWQEVERAWGAMLGPHFAAEEAGLLPALEKAGEVALVRRTLEEHAALRRCLSAATEAPVLGLRQFAELLEHHVRFEERELFETAQARLSAQQLEALAAT